VIWTTTAWTIPANQALNLNPALDYALVHTERGQLVLAASLVEVPASATACRARVIATTPGREARRHRIPPPAGARARRL
jgi:isoleucyl-tRNA synthetase